MTLAEAIRDLTRDVREAEAESSERLTKARADAQAARLRSGQALTELRGKEPETEGARTRVRAALSDIGDLRRRIEALQKELLERERTLEECREVEQHADGEMSRLRKLRHGADEDARKADDAALGLEADRVALQNRLKAAHREALRRYLGDLEVKIVQWMTSLEAAKKNHEELERMRIARHEDPKVGSQCEARDELRILLAGAKVPAVVGSLRAELTRVEGELNAMFPGALEAEQSAGNLDDIQEVFYAVGDGGETDVFLPLSPSTWQELESGTSSQGAALAMNVAWAMRKHLPFVWDKAEFHVHDDPRVFSLRGVSTADLKDCSVSMPLASVGEVAFVLTRLPESVMEAMRNEPPTA